MPSPAQSIEDLRKQIEYHNRLYYAEAKPKISDRHFDQLLEQLRTLEQANPELTTADSPTQRVGGQPLSGFRTVRHTQPMYSIDNTYDQQELLGWHQRVIKGLVEAEDLSGGNAPPIQFQMEPKIDGVAVNLRYEDGQLVLAVSRGDGHQGDDITQNIRTIRGIPLKLADDKRPPPTVLEVRGEVYMPDEEFARINHAREKNGDEPFANPRNATAGTLKQLNPSIVGKRRLKFIAHGRGLVSPHLCDCHSDFLAFLRSFGVPVSPLAKTAESINDAWQYIKQFGTQRENVGYGVDGVVIKVDRYDLQEQLGHTTKAPRWCIAYKYAAEQAITRLLAVDWQVGKTGKLTPRATMEPVFVAGTTVKHATLHNADEIERKNLRIGDTVVIEKAGEIIPQIIKVLKEHRTKRTIAITPPTSCPSCSEPVIQEEGEVAHRCMNPQCPDQIRERLIWFAARGQMDIDGLGEKMVHQLADAGVLDSYGDVYRLKNHREQILQLDRMGETKVANLLDAIEASKTRGLQRILAGLGIRHLGGRAAQIIAQHFGSIDKLIQATRQEIEEFEVDGNRSGIGTEIAQSLHRFLKSRAGIQIINELRAADLNLTDPQQHSQIPSDSPFTGKTIVITGTLKDYDRKDLTAKLQSMGANITSSVSRKTDFLITGESPGSKHDKATQIGIEIWSEERLKQVLVQLG